MIRLARWANAVASAGTRAIAPPSGRSWTAANDAVDDRSRDTMTSATSWSTRSMNSVLAAAVGW